MRRSLTLGLVGACLVGLVACSSDAKSDSPATSAFVDDANAICDDFFTAVKALEAPTFAAEATPSTLTDEQIDEGVAFFESYLELESEQLARLAALRAPSKSANQFDALVEAWSDRRDAADAALRAFTHRDDTAYAKASAAITAAAFEGSAVAQELQLEACRGEG